MGSPRWRGPRARPEASIPAPGFPRVTHQYAPEGRRLHIFGQPMNGSAPPRRLRQVPEPVDDPVTLRAPHPRHAGPPRLWRRAAVPRQKPVQAEAIDDSAEDQNSLRLEFRLLVALLPTLRAALRSRRDLVIEDLALRQQTRHPGRSTTPGHSARRPPLLDPAAPPLERLGREPRHRPARHRRALAPRRLPDLLELAVQARVALRPPSPAARVSGPHSEDGHREFVGRAPHPWLTAPLGLRGLRANRPDDSGHARPLWPVRRVHLTYPP